MSDKSPTKKQKSLSNSTKGGNKNCKLFITQLDPTTPKEELQAQLRGIIQKTAPIVKIDIKRNYNNRYSFAFVDFADNTSATKVLESCRDKEINGKKFTIDYQRTNPRDFRQYPRQNPSSNQQNYPKSVNKNQLQREQPRRRQSGFGDRRREEFAQKKNDRVQVKKPRRSNSRQDRKQTEKKKYRREQSPKRHSKKYANRSPSDEPKDRARNGISSKKYEGDKNYSSKRYESGYKNEKRNNGRRDIDSISEKSDRRSRYVEAKYVGKNQQLRLKERRHKNRRNHSYSSISSSRYSSSSYEQRRKAERKNNRNRRSHSNSSKEHRRYRNNNRR